MYVKNLHKNYRQVHVVYMLITYMKTTDVDTVTYIDKVVDLLITYIKL